MATLAVSAVVSIGVGIALNELFPPPDIEVEGPRLTELGYTSSAYGKFVNVIFGTDRVEGNIIDTTSPPIEEVITEEEERQGSLLNKGGGQKFSTTTYSYFLTCLIAVSVSGGDSIVKLFADGKLIFDASGTGQFKIPGLNLTFYPGGEDQEVDPEINARRGDGNAPAYRHLTTIKIDRLPLANFGNRIPNFTAEIAYNTSTNIPFFTLSEPDSFDAPNVVDNSRMAIDPDRDAVYSLKRSGSGCWAASLSDLTYRANIGAGSTAEPGVAGNGFLYTQIGSQNGTPVQKRDVDTGEIVAQLGGTSILLAETGTSYGNTGAWFPLTITVEGVGLKTSVFHTNDFSNEASIIDGDLMTQFAVLTPFNTDIDNVGSATVMPDNDRGVYNLVSKINGSDDYAINQISITAFLSTAAFEDDVAPLKLERFIVDETGTLTSGSVGDDLPSAVGLKGWAINRFTGEVILSNGVNMVLFDPQSGSVLAKRNDFGFEAEGGLYFTGNRLGVTENNEIITIDTRTLETIKTISVGDIGLPGSGTVVDRATQWDDRTNAVIISRSGAPVDSRIVKIFIDRITGEGQPLSEVVEALSTSYQGVEMAGLDPSDVDVNELTGFDVPGYTINRKSTLRTALEPLRKRYFFDGIESDWMIKFPVRGRTPVLTIPEDQAGVLRRDRREGDDPPIKEVRTQDNEIPMRVTVRYKNREADFQPDAEHDKRQRRPNPTMGSISERTIDLALVGFPTDMKRTASTWLRILWGERRRFATVVPWTYLELDPSDVYEQVYAGETLNLRMVQQDIGTNFFMDISGVTEDSRDYTSNLLAGDNLGYVAPSVPSDLPTQPVFLDAPLLSLIDLQFGQLSSSYAAFVAFSDSWPGATLYASPQGESYLPATGATIQATFAKIRVAPGPWDSEDNKFQSVADGGSMQITTLRKADNWQSAADETAVLNGANAIAVNTPNGVEIIQFQDVVIGDTDDNIVTLEKLLRGRLGTGDVTDAGGPAVSDEVVLLTSSTGGGLGGIVKFNTNVSDLSRSLFYRTVTVGTSLEDSPLSSFAYTGRDLKPYSVAHLKASAQLDYSLLVDWERRTRGPGSGEWLDGTGVVPLNELIEQYEVTFSTSSAGDFLTEVVNDQTEVSVSFDDLEGGGTSKVGVTEQNLPSDPDGQGAGVQPEAVGSTWVKQEGDQGTAGFSIWRTVTVPYQTILTLSADDDNSLFIASDVQATAIVDHTLATDINIVETLGVPADEVKYHVFFVNMYVATSFGTDKVRLRLELRDGGGKLLDDSADTGNFKVNQAECGVDVTEWCKVGSDGDGDFPAGSLAKPLKVVGVDGARFLRLRLTAQKLGTLPQVCRNGYDVIQIGSVKIPDDLSATVRQVSGSSSNIKSAPKTIQIT